MASLIDLMLQQQKNTPVVLDTTRNVKPDKPKGYLVETPIYKAPVEYFKDLATDTYDVVKGFKGKANDHELGKQNGVAMKLGSLAIAGYLMSFRPSNITKLMEVVGVGSFFASMALWPKLAIALPLKLRTGVDIQQKYVDSYGRKKDFFRDPQYLAWDLFSREKINKMGEKMNVPMDVPNREEVIREKARKMAVQGNTLWMATAGFATPIATGLICSGLEPVVENLRQKHALKSSQKLMDSQSWFKSTNAAPRAKAEAFEAFIAENIGSKLPDNSGLIARMNWSPSAPALMTEALSRDLDKILSNANNEITTEFSDGVYRAFDKTLKKAKITRKEVDNFFIENRLHGAQDTLVARYKELNPATEATDVTEVVKEVLGKLIDRKTEAKTAAVLKEEISTDTMTQFLNGYNRKVLDDKTASQLRKVFGELSNYFSSENKLIKWEQARSANCAESMRSHSWMKTTNEIFRAMGFSGKEIDEMSKEGSKTMSIFEKKAAEIASNPDRYKKVVTKIAEKIAEFDAQTGEGVREQYRDYVDTLCDISQKGLKKLGFTSTAEYIGGRPFIRNEKGEIVNAVEALSGSVRNAKKVFFDEAILSERSSMYRMLQILDFNKRYLDGTLKGQYRVLTDGIEAIHKPSYEKVADIARKSVTEYGLNMHEAKLCTGSKQVKPEAYKTIMKILYGVLPDRYVKNVQRNIVKRAAGVQEGVDDICRALKASENGIEAGYQVLLNANYDKVQLNRLRTGLDKDTISALYEAGKKSGVDLVDNMKTYMQTFIENVVNAPQTGALSRHNLAEHDLTGSMKGLAGSASNSLKQALVGTQPESLLREAANGITNKAKWLKRFGIGGAVLLAGTIISTLFLGYIPEREMYMTGDKK